MARFRLFASEEESEIRGVRRPEENSAPVERPKASTVGLGRARANSGGRVPIPWRDVLGSRRPRHRKAAHQRRILDDWIKITRQDYSAMWTVQAGPKH